jgi:regulator of replication initiation timing
MEARQVAHIAELEEANSQLHTELDAARSKLAEVEHREQALTTENEGLKKDMENARVVHDAMVRDKVEVQKTKCMKLQWFQDSIRKKLAELRHDTEASVDTLGGRSA